MSDTNDKPITENKNINTEIIILLNKIIENTKLVEYIDKGGKMIPCAVDYDTNKVSKCNEDLGRIDEEYPELFNKINKLSVKQCDELIYILRGLYTEGLNYDSARNKRIFLLLYYLIPKSTEKDKDIGNRISFIYRGITGIQHKNSNPTPGNQYSFVYNNLGLPGNIKTKMSKIWNRKKNDEYYFELLHNFVLENSLADKINIPEYLDMNEMDENAVGGGETQIEPKKTKTENKKTSPKIRSSQSSSLKNYFIYKKNKIMLERIPMA